MNSAAVSLAVLLIGLGALAYGIAGFVRGRGRLSLGLAVVTGVGLMAISGLLWLDDHGYEQPLLIVSAVVLLGGFLVYGALAVFLVINGVVILRRESVSLKNSLALLTGLAMLALPLVGRATLQYVSDQNGQWRLRAAAGAGVLLVMLLFAYVALCFAVFIVSTLLYLRLPRRAPAAAIVVLGAGLVRGEVTALLAARLDRAAGLAVDPEVPIITSGGQGADEPVAEGEAMRHYLIDKGVAPERIIAETESTTTRENLLFSSRLAGVGKPLIVVTSAYHSFRAAMLTRRLGLTARVLGARTARYYVPSALLREFVAILREHWRLHVVFGALILTGVLALLWESWSTG